MGEIIQFFLNYLFLVKVHLKGNSDLKKKLVAKRSLGYSKTFFISDIFFVN